MSNGDEKNTWVERCFAIFAMIGMMIVEEKRKAEEVFRWLEIVQQRADFFALLTAPRGASVSTEPQGGWAAEWARFYREVFDLTVDFTGIAIPAEQPGFGWVVMIPQGLTMNRAWAACRDQFLCSSYYGDDLDKNVPTSDRQTSAATYTKRFRNRVEADEELNSLSANDLSKDTVQSITLLERFVLELWYFWKTGGGHLDFVNWTLCAGSRGSDGCVPSVGWYDRQFRVYDYHPGHSDGHVRTRAAV